MNKKNIKVASIIMVSILLYRWFALWAYQSFFLPSINNVIKNNFPLITWIISGGIILFIVLNKKLDSIFLKVSIILIMLFFQLDFCWTPIFNNTYHEEIIRDLGNNFVVTRLFNRPLGYDITTCHIVKLNPPFEKMIFNFDCDKDSLIDFKEHLVYIKQEIKCNGKLIVDTSIIKLQ